MSESKAHIPEVYPYLGDRANRIANQLPPPPRDKAGWEIRRQEIRRQLPKVLGFPQREPMRAKTLASREEENGAIVVEDVMFLWSGNTYVSGNVVRPKDNSKPLPTLVMPPGWVGDMSAPFYSFFLYEMAKRGYLTLFIDDPHVMKRAAPWAGLYALASIGGTPVMGIQVFDTLRGLEYVLTRGDVDPQRIGITGLCQGSEQTWLAAALDDRFKVVAPVCGTTTFREWARMPGEIAVDLGDAAPYVGDVLRYTDWHQIGGSIAPRPLYIASNSGDNWWPKAGFDLVVETAKQSYKAHGNSGNMKTLFDLRSHDMTPFMPELTPWFDEQLKALPGSQRVEPASCGEPLDPDFSMMRLLQQRIGQQARALPAKFDGKDAWLKYRKEIVGWLKEACDIQSMQPGGGKVVASENNQGAIKETIDVIQDKGLILHMNLYYAHNASGKPAVILSHDSEQNSQAKELTPLIERLAAAGYVVCVPDHASPIKGSARDANNPVGNYGISSLYGVGDTVSLPPMAMRVWDDLRALAYLLERPEVDKQRIAIVGLGIGGVDAAMTTALANRIAALGVVGAMTVEDWAVHVAPTLQPFDRIMPYLPRITAMTDLQYIYSATAPRPLLLLDETDRQSWPEGAYQRVRTMAEHVYGIAGDTKTITAGTRQSPLGTNEIEAWLKFALDGK